MTLDQMPFCEMHISLPLPSSYVAILLCYIAASNATLCIKSDTVSREGKLDFELELQSFDDCNFF
jgi:hypothetical protein